MYNIKIGLFNSAVSDRLKSQGLVECCVKDGRSRTLFTKSLSSNLGFVKYLQWQCVPHSQVLTTQYNEIE